MAAEIERTSHKVYEKDTIGEVQIADEVVAIIAALAATEVEGVASMAGNITNEVIGKLGIKNLSKGVKVDVLEGVVTVSLALNLKYNYNIMDVTGKVQEKVKNAVDCILIEYCRAVHFLYHCSRNFALADSRDADILFLFLVCCI